MTPRDAHFTIKKLATNLMLHGWHVQISLSHGYIHIEGPNQLQDWFFQGQEYVDLMGEAEACAEKYDCHNHECLLWLAQGW
jgi:hypothetical protein